MGNFTGLDEYAKYMSGGGPVAPEGPLWMHKEGRVAGAAAAAPVGGRYTSGWQYEGSPSHGAVPTVAANCDNTTPGGMRQANPGGGRQKWNPLGGAISNAIGTYFLCDRLCHIGGLSGTTFGGGGQAVALTPPRYATGKGVEAWVEIYSQIGVTSTTIAMNYTNELGTAGQVGASIAIGNTGLREAQRMLPLSLAAGDAGVQAVASVTLAASTTTAGNFGVTLLRRLLAIPVAAAGFGAARSLVDGNMNEILTNACLFSMFLSNGTAIPNFDLFLVNIER